MASVGVGEAGQDGADAGPEQPLGLGLGVPHVEGLDVDRLDDEGQRPRSVPRLDRVGRRVRRGLLGLARVRGDVLGRPVGGCSRRRSSASPRSTGRRRLALVRRGCRRSRSAAPASAARRGLRRRLAPARSRTPVRFPPSSRGSAAVPDPARRLASSRPCLISAPNQEPGPFRGRSAPSAVWARWAQPAGAHLGVAWAARSLACQTREERHHGDEPRDAGCACTENLTVAGEGPEAPGSGPGALGMV